MTTKKRTNMKREDRRKQLLDCSEALFFSKGFDKTTVQDVLDLAGVSKGGFYHHFTSKDELLFGVIDRIAASVQENMKAIAENDAMSPLDQLHQFLQLEATHVKANSLADYVEVFRIMNSEQNVTLLNKFRQSVLVESVPYLTKIIERGASDGTFAVQDAQTAAELLAFVGDFFHIAYKQAVDARGTDQADAAAERLQKAMDMQFLTNDRVLGLPDGTTSFGWPEVVSEIMATVPVEQSS